MKLFTLPNIISLGNLCCGCLAAFFAVTGRPGAAFWLVVAAAACDFADGLAARLTGQYSEIGKQLDSLCDEVSFGVAPAAVLWSMGAGWTALALPLFSALRLARFNVDTTQSDIFTGMPTPACALLVASLGAGGVEFPAARVVMLIAALCYLLICPLPMFSLKFRYYGWRGNELRYCFLAAAAVCVALLGVGGVAATIAIYISASAVQKFACNKS